MTILVKTCHGGFGWTLSKAPDILSLQGIHRAVKAACCLQDCGDGLRITLQPFAQRVEIALLSDPNSAYLSQPGLEFGLALQLFQSFIDGMHGESPFEFLRSSPRCGPPL